MPPYCIRDVSTVYEIVIAQVIENSRDVFRDEGYGEDILQLLKETWLKKLQERNVIPVVPVPKDDTNKRILKSGKKQKPKKQKLPTSAKRKPKKQKLPTLAKQKRNTKAADGKGVSFDIPRYLAPPTQRFACSRDMPDLYSDILEHVEDRSDGSILADLSATGSQNGNYLSPLQKGKEKHVFDRKTLSSTSVRVQSTGQSKTLKTATRRYNTRSSKVESGSELYSLRLVEQQKQDYDKIVQNNNVMDETSKTTSSNRKITTKQKQPKEEKSQEILQYVEDLLFNLAEVPNENDVDNNVMPFDAKQSNDIVIAKNTANGNACNRKQIVKRKLITKNSSQSPAFHNKNLMAEVESITPDKECSIVEYTLQCGKNQEQNLQNTLVTGNSTIRRLLAQGALNLSNQSEENVSHISVTSSAAQVIEQPLAESNVTLPVQVELNNEHFVKPHDNVIYKKLFLRNTIHALKKQEMHKNICFSENKLHTSNNQHMLSDVMSSQEKYNFAANKKCMLAVESNKELSRTPQQSLGDIVTNPEITSQIILHGHQSITAEEVPKHSTSSSHMSILVGNFFSNDTTLHENVLSVSDTSKIQQVHSVVKRKSATDNKVILKQKSFSENRILENHYYLNEPKNLTSSNNQNLVGTKRPYLPKIVINGKITDERINNCGCLIHTSILASSRDTYICTLESTDDAIEEVKIILPNRPGMSTNERSCLITAPRWLLKGTRLPSIITPLIKRVSSMSIPSAKCILQHHVNKALEKSSRRCSIVQCDGPPDGAKIRLLMKVRNTRIKVTKKRLGETDIDSDDDQTDDENPTQVFESQNVIFCYYKLVKRNQNRWRIKLSCGIMHLNGKDYVFDTAFGKVEW